MRTRIGRDGKGGDEGSAIAENAMTMALIVAVFLVVCQFAYALHVRSTLTIAAIEAARRGAHVGASPQEAVERAKQFTQAARSAHIHASPETENGVGIMRVNIDAPLPVLGPLGVGVSVHATGRAVMEVRTP